VWRFYDGAARPSSAGMRKFQLSRTIARRAQNVIPAPTPKV
jgi:hypothetical protein